MRQDSRGIEHMKLRVDAGEDGVFPQQPGAEAVDGGDPGALQAGARVGSSWNACASFLRMLPAAFSVKVMARMRSGSRPPTRRRKYSTRTVVLPEPGPATTQASRWRSRNIDGVELVRREGHLAHAPSATPRGATARRSTRHMSRESQ